MLTCIATALPTYLLHSRLLPHGQPRAKAANTILAIYMVKGSIMPLDNDERHYSLDLGDEVVNEYKLELLCEDTDVDELVSAICTAARTGQPNAGWVTVTDITQAVPIQ